MPLIRSLTEPARGLAVMPLDALSARIGRADGVLGPDISLLGRFLKQRRRIDGAAACAAPFQRQTSHDVHGFRLLFFDQRFEQFHGLFRIVRIQRGLHFRKTCRRFRRDRPGSFGGFRLFRSRRAESVRASAQRHAQTQRHQSQFLLRHYFISLLRVCIQRGTGEPSAVRAWQRQKSRRTRCTASLCHQASGSSQTS